MTSEEAIELLKACKPLAMRLSAMPPSFTPVNIEVSADDLTALEGYSRVQSDPLTAGPGLLTKLCKLADLTQVEIYKLDQVSHLVYNRRFGNRRAETRFKSGSNTGS